jgi:hypothetical protein
MVTLFEKRYSKFNNKITDASISEYFGIKDTNLKFKLFKKNDKNELYFNIYYLKPQEKINFKNVPNEINDIIYSYLNDYIDIQVKIDYKIDYPFDYPVWTLLHFSSNINSQWDLYDIFSFFLNCHNNQHIRDWSPATDIEKDILDFIRKINIFEFIYTF